MTQLLQRAAHAHLGGGFAGAEGNANLGERAAFEETQHDGVPVAGTELADGFVEVRPDLVPDGGGLSSVIHGGKIAVVLLAPALGPQCSEGDETSGLMEPAGEHGPGRQGR